MDKKCRCWCCSQKLFEVRKISKADVSFSICVWKVYLQTFLKALSLLILSLVCQPWSVLMKILTWFWNQGAKYWAHRNPFKTCLNIQPRSKIYPVLQNRPTGTPRVSKNSQKYFTNKSVEFLLEISWNNIEKTQKGQNEHKMISVL